MLIGADGIWSKVRTQLIGHTDASYSGYTCYTGISDFVCPDIDTVAYRVFLGNGQYFVSSDVGGGKMQWYAFHEEAAGGKDEEGKQKQRLMKIFGHWYAFAACLHEALDHDPHSLLEVLSQHPACTAVATFTCAGVGIRTGCQVHACDIPASDAHLRWEGAVGRRSCLSVQPC